MAFHLIGLTGLWRCVQQQQVIQSNHCSTGVADHHRLQGRGEQICHHGTTAGLEMRENGSVFPISVRPERRYETLSWALDKVMIRWIRGQLQTRFIPIQIPRSLHLADFDFHSSSWDHKQLIAESSRRGAICGPTLWLQHRFAGS